MTLLCRAVVFSALLTACASEPTAPNPDRQPLEIGGASGSQAGGTGGGPTAGGLPDGAGHAAPAAGGGGTAGAAGAAPAGAGAAGGAAGGADGAGAGGAAGTDEPSAGQGAGGSAGAGAGGASGAGGVAGAASAPEDRCPGHSDEDLDANGYPDACEQVLWTADANSSATVKLSRPDYQSSPMRGFIVLMPSGSSTNCPELNGTGIPSLGHATSFPSGSTNTVPQIIDAQADEPARTLLTCLLRNDAFPISLWGYVGRPGALDIEDAYVLHDSMPFRNSLTMKAEPRALVGRHVLYWRLLVKHMTVGPWSSPGTAVHGFTASVEAVGY